jgi:hypothetical protein
MGDRPYVKIEEYKELLKGDVVEIGSERGEGSTLFLSNFAKANNLNFYSVDFESKAHQKAKNIIEGNAFQMIGEDFLDRYEKSKDKIACAYLDNFDFEFDCLVGSRLIEQQKKSYSGYGIELSNENSKKAHLVQTKKVVKHAAETCIIIFDDTFKRGEIGDYDGKGGAAVPYLLDVGWYILDASPPRVNGGYVIFSNKEIK